ncbi:MAG: hypothetical protein KF726_07980 [Anaerolineae bacterium]|nr:hypothetical protein [Anaerolineae bacterium]
MTEEAEQAKIEAYIRANYRTYNRKAIEDNLLRSGFSRSAIETAWAAVIKKVEPDWAYRREVEAQQVPVPKRGKLAFSIALTFIVLILMLIVPACLLLVTNAFVGPDGHYSSSGSLFYRYAQPINLLFAITEIGFLIAVIPLVRRGWTRGRILGLFLIVNFAWVFIILGTCFTFPRS